MFGEEVMDLNLYILYGTMAALGIIAFLTKRDTKELIRRSDHIQKEWNKFIKKEKLR